MQPIAAPLLQWFDANKRLLPFRQEPSAYHIWVSEIMLQQTRVAAAIPYYERFIAALPDPAALAACEPDALRKLWQGLGYYNRVNNMQKAARIVCEQYGGDLPADYDALRSLPGIGDYTAGAVASIAFGIPVPAVDGNVLRVFARLYNDDADVMAPATKKAFTVRVLDQMPKATPGPYNEALMELGALVCIPGTPHCEECPLADLCRGYAAGRADQLPVKPAPKAKGKVPVTVALIESEQGLLLQRRPARGLLAGLWQPAAWEKALTRDELTAALAGIGVHDISYEREGYITVRRQLSDEDEVLEMKLPALITTAESLNRPRYPSVLGIMKKDHVEIHKLTSADLDVDPSRIGLTGSPTRVKQVRPVVPPKKENLRIEGKTTDEAVDLLCTAMQKIHVI